MNEITCDQCGDKISIDKALSGQIEARTHAAAHKEHETEQQLINVNKKTIEISSKKSNPNR